MPAVVVVADREFVPHQVDELEPRDYGGFGVEDDGVGAVGQPLGDHTHRLPVPDRGYRRVADVDPAQPELFDLFVKGLGGERVIELEGVLQLVPVLVAAQVGVVRPVTAVPAHPPDDAPREPIGGLRLTYASVGADVPAGAAFAAQGREILLHPRSPPPR